MCVFTFSSAFKLSLPEKFSRVKVFKLDKVCSFQQYSIYVSIILCGSNESGKKMSFSLWKAFIVNVFKKINLSYSIHTDNSVHCMTVTIIWWQSLYYCPFALFFFLLIFDKKRFTFQIVSYGDHNAKLFFRNYRKWREMSYSFICQTKSTQ